MAITEFFFNLVKSPNRSNYLLSHSLKFLQLDLLWLSWFFKIVQGLVSWSAGFVGE